INRDEVAQTLRNLGLCDEQIQNVLKQASAAAQGGEPSPQAAAGIERAADRLGIAPGGPTLAVPPSLPARRVGGLTGTMGQRRVRRHQVPVGAVGTGEARVMTRPAL